MLLIQFYQAAVIFLHQLFFCSYFTYLVYQICINFQNELWR